MENKYLSPYDGKIIAGIVLYNPNMDRLQRVIISICEQVDEVVLYDNGSVNIFEIEKMINSFVNVIVLKGVENQGIAYALNRIFEYAKFNRYNWVLILDHDTICPNFIITEYCKIIEKTDAKMLCPNVIDREIAHNKYYNDTELEFSIVNRCIQTGNMIEVKLWEEVGKFDERLFIDFVDFDFCKRVEILYGKIYRCNRIIVDHELGHREKTKFCRIYDEVYKRTGFRLFKYLQYRNVYSYDRAYYCARNNYIFIKKYQDFIIEKKEKKDMFSRILKRIIRGKAHFNIFKASINGINAAKKMEIQKFVLNNVTKC